MQMAGNARTIHTADDTPYDTSYETYLRGELMTYSDEMLLLYGRFIARLAQEGKNLAALTMENTVHLYGYADLENNENYRKLKAFAEESGESCMPICARLEMDIMELPEEERAPFLEYLGITEMGLSRLINCAYDLLGLMSFLTAGKPEVRAWTIRKGSKAPEAAGKIHSDIERGFIRAEVVSFDDLVKVGNMQAAKEKGLIRSEGKDYVMRDGDIVLFRFNVSK